MTVDFWKDFHITDFFICKRGNQNNMVQLTDGRIPLVSARKNLIMVIKDSLIPPNNYIKVIF